ncbi:MAG: hypothetical protein ACI8Z1_002529 [Candidatus Azotimanducaceae bacterium]|jgi:hypothetical protein
MLSLVSMLTEIIYVAINAYLHITVRSRARSTTSHPNDPRWK